MELAVVATPRDITPMITYVKGDATLPQGSGVKIIAHVCNDGPGWGAGFVLALSARDKTPECEYRYWACPKAKWSDSTLYAEGTNHPFRLGEIQIVRFDREHQPMTYVCNMIAQILVSPGEREFGLPLKYTMLEQCLIKLNQQARFVLASIHMPRIGCGLAGGTWDKVEPIIERTLVDVPVTVYDLPDNAAEFEVNYGCWRVRP